MNRARWIAAVMAGVLCGGLMTVRAEDAGGDYPYRPVPFTDVKVEDGFWSPRMRVNREVTVPYDFRKSEETGRIANFARAGGLEEGDFEGIEYNDSDVFKIIEGASYSLNLHPDAELEGYLDGLIEKIAAAQEEDGYLYTYRTIHPDEPGRISGESRWSNLAHSHELYNVGHLYEAAVAHYRATGKRSLLDVAVRNADLVAREFGPEARRGVPGHQEIVIGLVKLHGVTGEERYLELAKFFLDERGRPHGRELYGAYSQDHKPVVEQDEAVGHAVRAGYMYSGMADVAALTGDESYLRAIDGIWNNVVSKKQYITGGVGATRRGEAFGENYELPNASAYNETCAAIANAQWNHRMFLLHGDAKYIDVLERVIYNGFLSGVSMSGDRFFYPNPLASNGRTPFNHGSAGRSPWFNTSCCPVNVVRFIPSIAGYVYAHRGDAAYVNLFIGGSGEVQLSDNRVTLTQRTEYPWDGRVEIEVDPREAGAFSLYVRIPGWVGDRPLPSDLYRYMEGHGERATLKVNGEPVEMEMERGFARIEREWKRGDVVELDLPMPIRRVLAHEAVEADRGRVAVERGPLVYCVEGVDHGGAVSDLFLPDDAVLRAEHRENLLGGVTVIEGEAERVRRTEGGGVEVRPAALTMVPYYAWAHRGAGPMAVWLPRDADRAEPRPRPTAASKSEPTASHVWRGDTVTALNDQIEPSGSGDSSVPRFTWWDHRGGEEWVRYDFDRPEEVSEVEVYWFDDTGAGRCRVPESWRVLYRDGEGWKPVPNPSGYGTAKDRFNTTTFDPVKTDALRLEVRLRDEFSAGILEWKVR